MIHRQEEILQWGRNRGIYEHSNPFAQSVKLWEEYAELRKAVLKKDIEGIKDGIGDVAVVTVHMAKFANCPLQYIAAIRHSNVEAVLDNIAYHLSLGPASKYSEAVTGLASLARAHDLTLDECIDHVIPIIQARTGRMDEHGVWVKDAPTLTEVESA